MLKKYYEILDVEEIRPLINKISIFGGLNSAQTDEVLSLLKTVKYEPGEYIYKRDELQSHIYIIKKGEVRMILEDKDVYVELISFKQGDCFGETSVIGIQTHCSNAYVVAPTELIVLEPMKLQKLFETDKEIFGLLILNIARETARRLHHSNEVLVKNLLSKGKD
jgi:CRP/FNR family cyclic AMP-dependent transcriptional regulator